eukprot:1547490-Amphidinium_carterae.1
MVHSMGWHSQAQGLQSSCDERRLSLPQDIEVAPHGRRGAALPSSPLRSRGPPLQGRPFVAGILALEPPPDIGQNRSSAASSDPFK